MSIWKSKKNVQKIHHSKTILSGNGNQNSSIVYAATYFQQCARKVSSV